MPICPWKHLIVFAFGAGSCVLAVSLIGTVAYNGKFGDNNKFLKYRYGHDRTLGQYAVANVSLGFICVVFLIFTIVASVKLLPGALILTGWILTLLVFLGTIISQILSLTESKYGNAIINRDYNYLSKSKFQKYLDKTGYEKGTNYTVDNFLPHKYRTMQNGTTEDVEINASRDFDFDYFMIPYFYNDKLYTVPSCKFSTIQDDYLPGSFPGIDPCNFDIDDDDAICLGGWNPSNFKNYWCYLYRHDRNENKALRDKSYDEVMKHHGKKQRNEISVTSYAAFYEINTIFMGLNAAGGFVLIIAIFLNMAYRPFDTNVENYQKLMSGQEANSDEDSSKAAKPGEPQRAKAVLSDSESDNE